MTAILVKLTMINGETIYIKSLNVEDMVSHDKGHTVITMVSGQKIHVVEAVSVVAYQMGYREER